MTDPQRLYTPRFFLLFTVTLFFMCGFSLQFHFGQYVAFCGGSERDLGWVLGLGMLGSMFARPFVGSFIDRVGAKPALLAGSLLAMAASACCPLTVSFRLICCLRILIMMAMATYFTAVAVVATAIAPPRRGAESLGTLGMGGFAGLMIGPALGDVIFSFGTAQASVYRVFFLASAGAFFIAAVLVASLRMARPKTPPADSFAATARIIRQYWPGFILLVGVAFSMSQAFHFYFLERMAEARGFENIKWFFFAYCPTAMVLRIVFRRLPERFGRRRTCLLGLLLFGCGMVVLRTAHSQAALVLPAIILGAGHCFVFPSMVDLSAKKLPPAHRATGTALILGAGDVGFLAGFITWGHLINAAGYNVTLLLVAGVSLGTAVVYAWSQRPIILRDHR